MTVIDKTKLPKVKFKDIKERQSFKYTGGVYTKLPKLFNRTECNAIDNEHYELMLFPDDEMVSPVKTTLIVESDVSTICLKAEDYNGEL